MSERKIFQDSVIPIPEQLGFIHNGLMVNATEPEHKNEEMTLLFSIETSPALQKKLEEMVERGETIPAADLQKTFSVKSSDLKGLTTWLKANGYTIEQVSKDGSSIYARAKVDQIEKTLEVKMIRVTKDGITYTAAQNAPSLPTVVGKNVHAIVGLQPFRQAHKNSRRFLVSGEPGLGSSKGRKTKNSAGRAALTEKKRRPVSTAAQQPPFLVDQIKKAYNAHQLNVSGKGQTIAILIDTFPADDDLKQFWKKNNLSVTTRQIKKINVKGGTLTPPEGEETLDVEWSSGVAPGAAIRIYASGSLQFVDLDRALDRILADLITEPSMRQLSISLGLGESFMGGPAGEVATQHIKFLKLAAAGVNVFVSSGDAGSNPDESGHHATGPTQAEYESSDPTVIGVGGTSLLITSDGNVSKEVAWTGSGGGKSKFFQRPSWQKGVGIPTGNERLVPDVSAVADPNTGALVILNGHEYRYGGTSWSAPVWAGICALLNEARQKAKKPLLPFLNPLLYPLLGTDCFRDIQQGSNGAYNAQNGYDMVTGIGVPNVEKLIQSLTK